MSDDSNHSNIDQKYIQPQKELYQKLLEYINSSDDNIEEKYQNLIRKINDQEIEKSKYELHLFLSLIVKISNNADRSSDLFFKIEKILLNFKETITQTYSNSELFDIFKSNKVLLLFLLKEKIIILDKSIINIMNK